MTFNPWTNVKMLDKQPKGRKYNLLSCKEINMGFLRKLKLRKQCWEFAQFSFLAATKS